MNHKQFISVNEVWEWLDQIPSFRTAPDEAYKPGLDRVWEACRQMGNPQNAFRTIHVAGTNGKGSLCTALGAIYENAGWKVGVYTSPHLITFNERVRVNGVSIPDEGVVEFFNKWWHVLEELKLSYFEVATCLGFWWFEHENVELTLLETGLGGRLDATNIVRPDLAVITSIDYDHTQILGDTISDIAREKAGIIKEGIPVLAGQLPGEALSVIQKQAIKLKSQKYQINSALLDEVERRVMSRSLFDEIAQESSIYHKTLELALAAILLLKDTYGNIYDVNVDQIRQGLNGIGKKNLLPARFEKLHSNYNWYFDGAHTPEAIDTLLAKIKREFENEEAILVFALMKERAVPRVLNKFSEFSKKYYYELKLKRSAKYSEIAEILPDVHRFPSNRTARLALMQSLTTQLVIFGGSFYFYSVVREWMND